MRQTGSSERDARERGDQRAAGAGGEGPPSPAGSEAATAETRRRRWLRWLPPLLLGAAIPAIAPWLGVLRAWVREGFGLGYLRWVTAGLALAAAAALLLAVVRIRERRLPRYGALALAGVLVALQVVGWTAGSLESDVLERIHLLEYGLLAVLLAAALRPRHEGLLLPVLAILAVALVSLADELVQWLTPVRVGDGRDVLLNLWAGAIGLLFGFALAPPARLSGSSGPASRCLAAGLGAAAVLAAALFFDLAHLGHEVRDPRAGAFVSWHSADGLERAARDRARRWAAGGVPPDRPLALEDRFRSEAGWHINARNHAVAIGDLATAWRENRILERWYGPMVALPGNHWPPEQKEAIRAELRAREPSVLRPSPAYRSLALRERVVAWPPRTFLWTVAALVSLGLLAVTSRSALRAPPG